MIAQRLIVLQAPILLPEKVSTTVNVFYKKYLGLCETCLLRAGDKQSVKRWRNNYNTGTALQDFEWGAIFGPLIFVKLFFVLTSARSLQQQCPNRCSYSCAFGNSFRA